MIGEIEAALIARVAAVNGMAPGQLGYRLATIGSYGGQYDESLSQAQPAFPAVWFALDSDEFARDQGNVHVWQPRWTVLCATRSLRNEQARRQGAAGEVGTYQLVQDLRRLLVGQTLGLPIDPIRATRISAVHTGALKGQPVAVYGLHLVTAYNVAVGGDDGQAVSDDPLIFINTEWDDGTPRCVASLTLEQAP